MDKLTIKERNEAAIELQRMWRLTLTVEPPDMSQFYRWLDLHYIFHIAAAILKTSEKEEHMENQNKVMTLDHAIRWTSSIANALKTKEEEENEMTTEHTNTETPSTPQPAPKKYLGGLIMPKEKPAIATDPKGVLIPAQEEQ